MVAIAELAAESPRQDIAAYADYFMIASSVDEHASELYCVFLMHSDILAMCCRVISSFF